MCYADNKSFFEENLLLFYILKYIQCFVSLSCSVTYYYLYY